MATWQVAFVKEQNVTFAVAVVRDYVISNRSEADQTVRALSFRFGCPVVLLGAQQHQTYGRPDIVRFLQSVHLSRLPWRQVNLAA